MAANQIYVYTGEGAGKTTASLGLAMRSIGHRHKVVVIQFLKWWKHTGEYKIQKMLKPYYEVYQFGRKGWIGLKNLTDADKVLAHKALDFAVKIAKQKKPHLLILDEINLALYCKLLTIKEVFQALNKLPKKTTVVLTGRYAPKELIKKADFVNEIKDIKHPLRAGIKAQKGIQY
ncbi:MAG: cob(I)yrinic acid a,c-diamide adenosyltransferase [Candidatus Nanoarchaeia archaeon]